MSFRDRLSAGHAHEERIIDYLRRTGWTAEPFGQALLSEEMRSLLRHTSSPVRWLPDIIAAKLIGDHVVAMFIDGKGGDTYRTSGRHCMEAAAVESARRFTEFANCDVFIVFDDGGALTPLEAIDEGTYHDGSGTRGSGTPFLLISVTKCRHVADVFREKAS